MHRYLIIELERSRIGGAGPTGGANGMGHFTRSLEISLPTREGGAKKARSAELSELSPEFSTACTNVFFIFYLF